MMLQNFIKSYIFALIFCLMFYQGLYYYYPQDIYPMLNIWFNDINNKIYLLLLFVVMFYIYNNKISFKG